MKTNIARILALATLITCAPGCAWVRKNPQGPAAIAQTVATTVSREVLTAHPEFLEKFMAAQAKLAILEAQPLITAADVVAIVNLLPVKYLQTPTARISVDGVVLSIQLAGNPTLPTQSSEQLRLIVHGLKEGVAAGIKQAIE